MKNLRFIKWGVSFTESTSLKSHIIVSNQLALVLFLLSLFLEVAYLSIYPVSVTSMAILGIGLTSLLTIPLNRLGFIRFSRFWLSTSITIATLLASLYAKIHNYSITQEYDYFNYRIMIMAVSILPAILFALDEAKTLFLCLLFSVIIILFFDPIHLFFGVGNKAALAEGSRYYFSNVVIGVSYAVILGSIIFLKSAAERSEVVIEKLLDSANLGKQRLVNYQYALLAAANEYRNLGGDEGKLNDLICSTLSRYLNVNRVSIWSLNSDGSNLTRNYLFEKDGSTDEQVQLNKKDFPAYFFAISNKPFIVASDARFHEDTKEFTDSYLMPLGIYSMLDCPISFNNKPVGVICCENQYIRKDWNPEDSIFIQSLADLFSMHLQHVEIKKLLMTVQEQNEELAQQTDEIKSINENLESLVKDRTKELEERNKRLVEYGFINSHLVRAPLARILGLTDLIAREVKTQDKMLIEALIASSGELDSILFRITNVLNENENLSREVFGDIVASPKLD